MCLDFLIVNCPMYRYACLGCTSQHLRIRTCDFIVLWICVNQIPENSKLTSTSINHLLVKELLFLPFLHKKTFNVVERSKKRCVENAKKIRGAGSFCMDQSYFRFLFWLARKSKQSWLTEHKKKFGSKEYNHNKLHLFMYIAFVEVSLSCCPMFNFFLSL